MKLRIFLVQLFLFAFLGVAFADCVCKEPQKPELPSDRADGKEMESAGKQIKAYNKDMKTYRDCLVACLARADNDIAGVVSGWNHAVELYNNGKK